MLVFCWMFNRWHFSKNNCLIMIEETTDYLIDNFPYFEVYDKNGYCYLVDWTEEKFIKYNNLIKNS